MTQPSTPLSNARDRPKRRRDEKEKINEASDEAVRSFTTELEATMNNFLTTLPVRIDSLQKAASDAAALHTRLGKKQSTGNGSGVGSSSSSDTTVVTPRPFPDNTPLMEQLSSLKAVALELIPQFDAVQDWILLRVPPIKDEDNIGVEVQETVLSQMAAYYKLLKNVHNEQNEYISRRAELETNYRKQPGATSWMRAIEIHDEDEWQDVVLAWKTLQRSVILTYSILTKNMEKIKEPRQTMRMMHL